jgi:hypothetical protein
MIRLFLPLLLTTALSASADSFLYVSNGQSITNGAPVNVKALKARYNGSFFWFSIAGKSYITRDTSVLRRINDVYTPLFSSGGDFTIGEQAALFSKQMALLQEQIRIGLEPRPGEDAKTAARRLELRFEQNELAQRQNELADRANRAAEQANDFAARLDGINRKIELRLHDIGAELVRQRIAVETE